MNRSMLIGQHKVLTKEIEMMLNNIKEMGFNISSFQEKLDNLNETRDNCNNCISISKMDITEQMVRELTELKNTLSKYNDYYRVYSTSKWVELKISDDLSKEELEKCVSEMIGILRCISRSNLLNNDVYDGENVINYAFSVAYRLIKMELIMTGESQLYLYSLNDDICKLYFDSINIALNYIDNVNKYMGIK